jgi:hypothetical protein
MTSTLTFSSSFLLSSLNPGVGFFFLDNNDELAP